jgi:hypothetical protein
MRNFSRRACNRSPGGFKIHATGSDFVLKKPIKAFKKGPGGRNLPLLQPALMPSCVNDEY